MRAPDYPALETPDLLLAALERANDAVVIIDSDLHVSHCNAAAKPFGTGPRRNARLPRKPSGPRRSAAASDGDVGLGSGRGRRHHPRSSSEIVIHRKDGSPDLAALSLSQAEVGGQIHTIAFIRDITTEVDRRERLALLTTVADETNRAAVVTDQD